MSPPDTTKNPAPLTCSEAGRRGRGKPKTMTPAGLAARRASLVKARQHRWTDAEARALLKLGLTTPEK